MNGASRFGVGLVTLVAWGVLSFGAVYPWAYWPLFVGAAGLGVWAIRTTRAWGDPRMRWTAYALAGVLGAMAVELIALPAWLVARISPGVDRFFRQFEVGYHPANLHALSLAPDATATNLVEVIALGLLFIGLTRAMRHLKLEWLVSQIMGLGVAVAVIGIVQKALGKADHALVYGFWQPRQGGNPFGPFVNRNHFAGWMVMILPVVAAYSWALVQQAAAHERPGAGAWARWGGSVEGNRFLLVASASVIMGAALVFTGSRTGIASFAVALAALAVFIVTRLSSRRGRLLAASYLFIMLFGAVAWAGSDIVVSRFQRAPGELEGRFAAWRDTVRIMTDFPVFGTGVGAYGKAMLVYQSRGREVMYAEAHNDYLQLAAEGGVLVVAPVMTLLGVIVVGIAHRLRSGDDHPVTYWVRRGAVAGMLAVAAQSLMEFSLQMPGNAVTLVLVAAIALHRPRSLTHAYRV